MNSKAHWKLTSGIDIRLILLGAGASVPFGLPTMQELTEVALTKVSEFDRKLPEEILNKLRMTEMKPDFESIYTILEAIVDPVKGIREAGPFAAFLLSDSSRLHPRTDINDVLEELRRTIYKKCSIGRGMIAKVVELYDILFNSTLIPDWSNVPTPYQSPASVGLNRRIVTTNYDMALELYFRSKRIRYSDGFTSSEDQFVKEFAPHQFRQSVENFWLMKLHGSLWQFWYENKIIKTIDDPENSSLPIKIERQMMIYPSKEKPILQDPYFWTYAIFKLEPWNKLIAIGYSFRDDPVNTAIADNMDWNPQAQILIINPNATEVRDELPERLQRHSDRIGAMGSRFEDPNLGQGIKDWLDPRRYNLYNNPEGYRQRSTI